jgi:hypothetical protein
MTLTRDENFELWHAATQPGAQIEKINPRLLFFFHMGFAINQWAIVDRNLFNVFAALQPNLSNEKIACLFYETPYISDHFGKANALAKGLGDKKQKTPWRKVCRLFGQNIGFRNRLAHDPANQIVSAVGTTSRQGKVPLNVPPPIWEFNVDRNKLLKQKKPGDRQPITIEGIIDHIERVTRLNSQIETFWESIP